MRVREATVSDWRAIETIRHAGFRIAGPIEGDGSAFAGPWNDHPFGNEFHNVPIGWLLEDRTGRPIGTFSNHWGAYHYQGQFLRAGIASAWAVLPGTETTVSLSLLEAYLHQPNVDLLIDTTANIEAGRVMQAMRMRRIPVADLDHCSFWILDYGTFLAAAARKSRIPLPRAAGRVAGAPLNALTWLARMPSRRTSAIESVRRFDHRFDTFWGALCRTFPQRLTAIRDARTLRWHFRQRLAQDRLAIQILTSGSEIRAYSILAFDPAPPAGRFRARLVDLQFLEPDPVALQPLIKQTLDAAVARKAFVLEVVGFSPEKLRLISDFGLHRRRLPSWPFLFKARAPGLAEALTRPATWDPSSYDGDSSL